MTTVSSQLHAQDVKAVGGTAAQTPARHLNHRSELWRLYVKDIGNVLTGNNSSSTSSTDFLIGHQKLSKSDAAIILTGALHAQQDWLLTLLESAYADVLQPINFSSDKDDYALSSYFISSSQ